MIFNENNSLSIVYNLKNKLHIIINSKYIKLDKFKDTINEWCLEAKSQGIDDLNDFSESLKGYKIV